MSSMQLIESSLTSACFAADVHCSLEASRWMTQIRSTCVCSATACHFILFYESPPLMQVTSLPAQYSNKQGAPRDANDYHIPIEAFEEAGALECGGLLYGPLSVLDVGQTQAVRHLPAKPISQPSRTIRNGRGGLGPPAEHSWLLGSPACWRTPAGWRPSARPPVRTAPVQQSSPEIYNTQHDSIYL